MVSTFKLLQKGLKLPNAPLLPILSLSFSIAIGGALLFCLVYPTPSEGNTVGSLNPPSRTWACRHIQEKLGSVDTKSDLDAVVYEAISKRISNSGDVDWKCIDKMLSQPAVKSGVVRIDLQSAKVYRISHHVGFRLSALAPGSSGRTVTSIVRLKDHQYTLIERGGEERDIISRQGNR